MPHRKRLLDGSTDALGQVYRLYFKRVFYIALRYLKSNEAASDVTQDVFLKLWRNREKISLEIPLERQLFIITKSVIVDHFRKLLTQEKLLSDFRDLTHNDSQTESGEMDNSDGIDNIGPAGNRDEKLKKIYAIIEQLPGKQKEVFKMLKLEGFTYEEVASVLHISTNTVSNHLSSAIKFIRQKFLGLFFSLL